MRDSLIDDGAAHEAGWESLSTPEPLENVVGHVASSMFFRFQQVPSDTRDIRWTNVLVDSELSHLPDHVPRFACAHGEAPRRLFARVQAGQYELR